MSSAAEDWARTRKARRTSFQSIIARDRRIQRSESAERRQSAASGYMMICDECRDRYAIGGSEGIFLCPECYRERFGRDWKGDMDECAGKMRERQRER